jgi:hypothetical protein
MLNMLSMKPDCSMAILTPDFLFEIEAIAFMMAATPVFMRL